MKFIKSNLAKKLIIILVALTVFNVAIPQEVKAWTVDYSGGILLKPILSSAKLILLMVDATLGLALTGYSTRLDTIGIQIEAFAKIYENIKNGTWESVYDESYIDQLDGIISKVFIGPDTIFSGEIIALNANIFTDINIPGAKDVLEGITIQDLKELATGLFGIGEGNSIAQPGVRVRKDIREAIAGVYYVLRNMCGFIMLAGLIFTGIRIILSSNMPTKKGIYLTYLQEWLIGMALLILSHIIMIGIFWVSDALVDALAKNLTGFGGLNFSLAMESFITIDKPEQVIYIIMWAYLIWLTVIFAISYFKRFLWICVLTIFAPVISTMYAFGNQTKQIYSKWLREYMLTVFVQPFHIIVYSVLVAVPLSVANNNFIENLLIGRSPFELLYVLIAIGFIRPAEKYMRELFGMGQGIVNQASYDSGKQTFDALKQATIQIAKTVGVIAAGVATAGGAAAATIATGGAAAGIAATGGAAAIPAGGLLGEAGAGALGEAAGLLGEAGTGDAMGGLLKSGLNSATSGLLESDAGNRGYLSVSAFDNDTGELIGGEVLPRGEGALPIDESDEGMKEAIADGMNRSNVESGSNINASNVTITTSNLQIEGANVGDKTDEGFKEAIAEGVKDANMDGFDDFDLSSAAPSFMESLAKSLDKENVFEDIAKLGNEAYKGINSVRDTFFVNGAPGDWKGSSQLVDGLLKERLDKKKATNEREKANWANDKSNVAYVAAKYLPQMKEIYKGKSDAYIQMQADEKAKKELAKMSEFVTHGIDDVRVAFELYQDQKKYGYSAEEAIRTRAGFERFNSNPENIAHINQHYNVNCTSVSQVMPNAREYYNNGYNNIRDVDWLNYMATKLQRSPDYVINVDQALKKKGGKINYNGSNRELKDVIDQINKHYSN